MPQIHRWPFALTAAWLVVTSCAVFSADAPALLLRRGIAIDRQVRRAPPERGMTVHADDLRLIRRMGFGFVKFIVNPAVIEPPAGTTSSDGLNRPAVEYFDRLVEMASRENLPAVLCLHPEDGYKREALGKVARFEAFLALTRAYSRHVAARFTPRHLALQLLTEPYGTSDDPAAWNHWDRLQRRLWRAVREEMPGHTLILSGDAFGSIEGLYNIRPVDDANVLYCFTFYEPFVFTFQGGAWRSDIVPGLRGVPYPVDAHTAGAISRLLAPVPASWQATAKAQLNRYVAECWNGDALAARMEKAAAWRRLHGNRPALWCAEFGCYQQAVRPEDRVCYLADVRKAMEDRGIGWAYWSYNETFTAMTSARAPFGPAAGQTPDPAVLNALMPSPH